MVTSRGSGRRRCSRDLTFVEERDEDQDSGAKECLVYCDTSRAYK
jgi:hypothetical protein